MQENNQMSYNTKKGRWESVDLSSFKQQVTQPIAVGSVVRNLTHGDLNLSVNFTPVGDSLYLSSNDFQMIFEVSRQTIDNHLNNIYGDYLNFHHAGIPSMMNLPVNMLIKEILTSDYQGGRYSSFYHHDIFLELASRINTINSRLIKHWVNNIIHEYQQNMFVINPDIVKDRNVVELNRFTNQVGHMLPERIQELQYWVPTLRRVLDNATDWNNVIIRNKVSGYMQNIAHAATCGSSAAGIIRIRCNAEAANCGLQSYRGDNISFADLKIGKNYLSDVELRALFMQGLHVLAQIELYVSRYGKLCLLDICRLYHMYSYTINGYIVNYGPILSDWPLTHTFDFRRKDANRHARIEFEKYNLLCIQQADSDIELLTNVLVDE